MDDFYKRFENACITLNSFSKLIGCEIRLDPDAKISRTGVILNIFKEGILVKAESTCDTYCGWIKGTIYFIPFVTMKPFELISIPSNK